MLWLSLRPAGPTAPTSAASPASPGRYLVILDDFGLKPLRPPAPEDLYEIVAERYEKGSMIVTSNRAFPEWPELFGEPLLASAALDRLAHDAHQIVITGESYRDPGDTEACGREERN